MKRTMLFSAITVSAVLMLLGRADAATIAAGTKLQSVLAEGVDSATLKPGADFKLRIDDPSQPSLAGAAIHGHVTDVGAPSGLDRARIGFVLDYIRFKNGQREPIHAEVLDKRVTQTNTAYAKQEAVKFSLPPMPVGTVTPGPIAWQMTFSRGSAPSVTPPPIGNSGGYVYAEKPNETIVVPPGAPVTLRLTADLTTP